MWPSRHESLVNLTAKVYGSPTGRTTGEWMLINKGVSPVMLPVLLATANTIVNQNQSKAAAAAALAPPSSAEPDLDPATERQSGTSQSLAARRILVGHSATSHVLRACRLPPAEPIAPPMPLARQ